MEISDKENDDDNNRIDAHDAGAASDSEVQDQGELDSELKWC